MTNPLPDNNAQYLQGEYWNNRFHNEQQYDWFKDFSEFKHLCVQHLHPGDSVLILGCGNSTLTQDLYDSGFRNLTSIDLSDVVIDHMHKKAAAACQPEIKWQVSVYRSHKTVLHSIAVHCLLAAVCLCAAMLYSDMFRLCLNSLCQSVLGPSCLQKWHVLQVADMLDLPYSDATFDVVIEKGTMDVLFVDNDNPFDPKAEVRQRVFQMLDETHRSMLLVVEFMCHS